MKKYDITIIGAGAAGLMCAARLSQLNLNKKILLIDKMDKLGKKVLATGNGKCNLSNENITEQHYYSSNKEFIARTVYNIQKTNIISYFNSLGLITKTIDSGYYPITEQAISVVDTLKLTIEENENIDILLETEVKYINHANIYEIQTDEEVILSDILVLATGGKSSQIHGSDGSGYKLLENLNHDIISPYPALVQLKTDKKEIKYLKGLRTKATASIYINDEFIKEETGEIQFTEYGLSGICIFNLSHIASYNKNILDNQVTIKLDLVPSLTYEQLQNHLKQRQIKFPNRLIDYYLTGFINNKISYALYQELKIDFNEKVNTLSPSQIDQLCHNLKNYSFNIISTNDFDNSQVTAGGINTEDINQYTYESSVHKKLYIIGEILDIHGDCGGYNLTFAFSSAYVVANKIGEYYDKNK